MSHIGLSKKARRLGPEWLGRQVSVVIDRPVGTSHPDRPALVYRLNYGFILGTLAGDGEPIDVYLMGESCPLRRAIIFVVAIIHRHDDVEDKLVGCRKVRPVTPQEVMQAVGFVERWFDVTIETLIGNASFGSRAG